MWDLEFKIQAHFFSKNRISANLADPQKKTKKELF
jgi:hypothetical protein